ncbi:tyrosine-type recombinase/integrase [Colwellia sp. BRX10-3]|uniref:tyrosine-type recombinase/integrase n=1 Tax=Colwellia sp. BRX10-3 TaxID=2759844 RepID=UPI0015F3D30E|nr:site-specific integrase [Colwellia sp. BRX10-3]MBA6390453.1 tyrosine-type recombinase/integrase [Colwellia sp. BRX10-3]
MLKERKSLNAATIKAMKHKDKDLSDIEENEGLRVSCAKAGTKTFCYRYKSPITNKLCQIKIGRFPSISLADARVKLQELKVIRNDGRCPASEQKIAKKDKAIIEKKLSSRMTVADVIELYLSQYIEDRTVDGKVIAGARKQKGQDETRRTLYCDAVKELGDRYAEDVTRKNIVNMIMGIVERGSNVQAGNVLREFNAAYEYSIGLEKFPDEFANPALLAKNSLRQAKVRLTSKRATRVFSDRELSKFLNWLPSSAFTQTQKRILRFTLWTGCRTGEVCEAEWNDIDLNKATWHLKATKTDVERYVQLSKQAIDFLRQLRLETGKYLFPSFKTKLPIQQKAITEQAWLMRRDEKMLDIEHWVPHDLRRTVRTGLSRLKCRNEVAEAVLGHARSGIEGTYDLHKYEEDCKEWLQKWADHMDELITY